MKGTITRLPVASISLAAFHRSAASAMGEWGNEIAAERIRRERMRELLAVNPDSGLPTPTLIFVKSHPTSISGQVSQPPR